MNKRTWVAVVGLGWVAACEAQVAPGLPPRIDIVAQKARKAKFDGTDYDNVSEQFQMNIKIKNLDGTREVNHLTAHLFVYGKFCAERNAYQMLDRATSQFDLPRRGEHAFQGETVELQYDDNFSAKYGVKYDGYIVVVKDQEGKVVAGKATKPAYL